MKFLLRISLFILLIILSALFVWWLFIPLAVVYAIKVKNAFEILLAGALFDSVYYFSPNPWFSHNFLVISLVILIVIIFLGRDINWKRWL